MRSREKNSFIPYQVVFDKISNITAKKLMERINREEDATRNEWKKKGQPVQEIKVRDYVYLKKRETRKN
jgi:hypothetical protein